MKEYNERADELFTCRSVAAYFCVTAAFIATVIATAVVLIEGMA